ncbi:MAG: ribonuclease D [Deltaproteobacteria bacterium]|nr:MAG: ribonuclease D [Deltaproteobacteria bacterium]
MGSPKLISRASELAAVVGQCLDAPRVAVDVEGNGLHVFRARLCALQLGWRQRGGDQVAIIDTLELSTEPLAALLGKGGPVKVLHDLTFDARMLGQQGIELGNVRDTSVAARFLGESSTGLAALAAARLGITLNKFLQDHNWAERPFTGEQLDYLAGDVSHLLALDDVLTCAAEEQKITAEIAVEWAYKLKGALAPPQDQRPTYLRIKGYGELNDLERAVLRRLVLFRAQLAEREDVPEFRVAPSGLLLALARRKPRQQRALRQCCGNRRKLPGEPEAWLTAVRRGIEDGAPPLEEQPSLAPTVFSRHEIALRKQLAAVLSKWRRREAADRSVDLQVVLPGHCMGPVTGVLATPVSDDGVSLRDRLGSVEGFGECRVERYEPVLAQLASDALAAVEKPLRELARPV